jgi:ferredoxin
MDMTAEPTDVPKEQAAKKDAEKDRHAPQVLDDLLAFHLFGRRPPGSGDSPTASPPVPALLDSYRDLTRIRHDYPVCLNGSGPETAVRPLTQVVDELIDGIEEEGDAGEQLKRTIYRLEATVRTLAELDDGAKLSELLDRAAQELMATSTLTGEKKDSLNENVSSARRVLDADGEVLNCERETPGRIFKTLVTLHWREHCAKWRDELESLIYGLEGILGADFNRSDESRRPEHLRDSLGTPGDDVDVQAMSTILSSGRHESPLSGTRRERVQSALSVLRRVEPVFRATHDDGDTSAPFRVDTVVADCAEASELLESRIRTMVDFFRSVRIAQLEVANLYREKVHDAFFEAFDRLNLTEDELSLCPPLLVELKSSALSSADIGALLELLGTLNPIKILLQLDDLCQSGDGSITPFVRVRPIARTANMAMALGHAYVMQAPVSRVHLLHSGFLEGFRYDGPALFSVYAGGGETVSSLSDYHVAASAAESRVLPIFRFDPGKGPTMAERINVVENPQFELDWPRESFRYKDTDGEEVVNLELAFTPADFLYCDPRFSGHFWLVPEDKWHDSMMPLGDYLDLSDNNAATRVPYIVVVDGIGQPRRVVVTRSVVTAVVQCASFWRGLQETGGIDNSFVANALAEEKVRLAEEKRQEVEAIEKNYVAQLDQDIGELTREIVQRIANQLIAGGDVGLGVRMTQSVAPPPSAPSQAVAEPQTEAAAEATIESAIEEDEDEVAVSFDDAYIDTPLCTSCNECTDLNRQLFAYNENKQAVIKDATAGPFSDLVLAAEKCPVKIIHPGKPKNPDEPGIADWIERAAPFN